MKPTVRTPLPLLVTLVVSVGLAACSDSGSPDDVPAVDAGTADPDGGSAPSASMPPVELTADLCDDPSKLALIVDALGNDGSNPTYGTRNMEQLQRMLQAPTEGPFYMVNLIKYRDQAEYPDGRATDLTGREANALYAPTEFLAAIGARVVFMGPVNGTSAGEDGAWDDVAIVEYPCPLATLAMSAHPEFQARSVHKEAGLQRSIVMVTHLNPLPNVEVGDAPFPSTPEDPAFEMVQVIRHRAQAQYAAGSNEPARTGREAMEVYTSQIRDAEQRVGVTPRARLAVQGVFIGDERTWDEVWIDRVPSRAAYEALLADPAVVAAQPHRDAAVEEAYGLMTAPLLSTVPVPSEENLPPQIGYEILQILSADEIVVWLSADLTPEEFDAIELPQGWFKNQPREGDPDRGEFARSPGTATDGEFTNQAHFGHDWTHVATIVEANISLDEQGLLRGNRVSKRHEITFDAGRTLSVIVSPEGESFVRVSRDAGRTRDVPTLPDDWQLLEYETQEALTIQLPNPILNIRTDNEDSFQGPVTELDVGN